MNRILTVWVAIACMALLLVPLASAQRYRHRQDMKNQWRNLAYGSAAVGVLGLLTKHSELTLGGLAGAAYSAYRYEEERKQQSRYGHYRGYYGREYGRSYAYSEPYHGWNGHDNGLHRGWFKHHRR